GKSPAAGIDIEPNHVDQEISDIVLENCDLSGNDGRGFVVDSKAAVRGVRVTSCTFSDNGSEDIALTGADGSAVSGVVIDHCRLAGTLRLAASSGAAKTYGNVSIRSCTLGVVE